jgi:hypothetical protein
MEIDWCGTENGTVTRTDATAFQNALQQNAICVIVRHTQCRGKSYRYA